MALPAYELEKQREDLGLTAPFRLLDFNIASLVTDPDFDLNLAEAFDMFLESDMIDAAREVITGLIASTGLSYQGTAHIQANHLDRRLSFYEANGVLPTKPVVKMYNVNLRGSNFLYFKRQGQMASYRAEEMDEATWGLINKFYDVVSYKGDQVPQAIIDTVRTLNPAT